jgi:hypothetical protein
MQAANQSSSYNGSSYIIDQNPGKYGGYQRDYQEQARSAIAMGSRKITEAPKERSALIELFFQILDDFAKRRQSIAKEHDTPDWEQFGCRRYLEGREFYHTILDHEYQRYNAKPLSWLADKMQPFSLEQRGSSKLTRRGEESSFNRNIFWEVEILESNTLEQLQWSSLPKTSSLPPEYPVDLEKKRFDEGGLSSEDQKEWRDHLKRFKERYPDVYKRIKMASYFNELQKNFPSPNPSDPLDLLMKEGNLKSFFALGTIRLEVEGKMYAVSQVLTWLYRDFKQHPIERMKKNSTVMILHQDVFLIDATLREIAKIFAQAVLCDKKELNELKSRIALFRYYFAHAMPFERGSAAIAEWFETALYAHHQLILHYNREKMVDLEALTTYSLSEFVEKYDSMIELTEAV